MRSVHIIGSSVDTKQKRKTESHRTWQSNNYLIALLFIIAIAVVVTLFFIYSRSNIVGVHFWSIASFVCLAFCVVFLYSFIEVMVDSRYGSILEDEAIKQVINNVSKEKTSNIDGYGTKEEKPNLDLNIKTSPEAVINDEMKHRYRVYYYPNN